MTPASDPIGQAFEGTIVVEAPRFEIHPLVGIGAAVIYLGAFAWGGGFVL